MGAQKEKSEASNTQSARKMGFIGARIRTRRTELGLSLREMAERTGLTASFLSLIERDQNSPSLESLHRIAEALEVPFLYFAQTDEHEPVVRRDERVQISFPPGNLTYELLVPHLKGRMEVFIARLHPEVGNVAQPAQHVSEECIYVLQGNLKVGLQDGEYILRKGDSIYFHGSQLREISAHGRHEAVFLSAITPPVL